MEAVSAIAGNSRARKHEETSFAEWARRDEISADDTLLQPYRDGVARIANLSMNDSCDATDVIRETFLNVSCNTQTFDGNSSLRIWIFSIAVSTIRKRERWWKTRIRFQGLPPRGGSSCGLTSDQAGDNEALIRHGLSRHSRGHRWILLLRDIEGLSYDEIAQVLGVSTRTVKSRLTSARTRMLNSVLQLVTALR